VVASAAAVGEPASSTRGASGRERDEADAADDCEALRIVFRALAVFLHVGHKACRF
jgi:hypothetical protein